MCAFLKQVICPVLSFLLPKIQTLPAAIVGASFPQRGARVVFKLSKGSPVVAAPRVAQGSLPGRGFQLPPQDCRGLSAGFMVQHHDGFEMPKVGGRTEAAKCNGGLIRFLFLGRLRAVG